MALLQAQHLMVIGPLRELSGMLLGAGCLPIPIGLYVDANCGQCGRDRAGMAASACVGNFPQCLQWPVPFRGLRRQPKSDWQTQVPPCEYRDVPRTIGLTRKLFTALRRQRCKSDGRAERTGGSMPHLLIWCAWQQLHCRHYVTYPNHFLELKVPILGDGVIAR